MLNIAQKAARKAGNVILQALDRLDTIQISEKSTNNFVTNIDKQAEHEIIHIIRKAYPGHSILAEESGETVGDDYQWIIDPLDGTTNFIHGYPHFAVSIAVKFKNQVQHAVIYDPVRDELFTATRGSGARLNDRRIRVSNVTKLENAFLATGFPEHNKQLYPAYLQCSNNLMPKVNAIRRTGSAALDLAYVAAGRFDGYWEPNLKAWDIAAGALLVKEAGGYVTDFNGKDDYLDNGDVIAATPKIYPHIYQQIQQVLKATIKAE